MKMDTSALREEKRKTDKQEKEKTKQVRNVVKICSKKTNKQTNKQTNKNEEDLFHTQHTHQSTKNTNERVRSITQHVGNTLINL